jgi:hypothetical protein
LTLEQEEQEEEEQRDLVRYTVKCGYRDTEDLEWFHTHKINGRFPGQPDRISCRCKGCGSDLEEIVGVEVILSIRQKKE